MTNKLVVIINSLKVPKIKKIFCIKRNYLYHITAASRTPDYGALNLLNPPPPRTKFLGAALPVLYTSPIFFFTFCTYTASLPSVIYIYIYAYLQTFFDTKAWPYFVFHLAVQHTKFPGSTTSYSVEEG